MADQVTIHQSLHGYADGHRLISASIQLHAADAKTVLTLSDSSGASGWQDQGYLTGYPLRESGLYALARTWQAKEMPRPGCVWTHTLFVEWADLANLQSASPILSLFKRPDSTSTRNYTDVCYIEQRGACDEPSLITDSRSWCKRLMLNLYGFPDSRIVIEQPVNFDPELPVVSIWLQQWPRLRRSFSFCTATTIDRSGDRMEFDVQVLAGRDKTGIQRLPNTRVAEHLVQADVPWVEDALDDLFGCRNEPLRAVLLRIGAEVPNGRAAFSSLVRFHRLLANAKSNPSTLDPALSNSIDAIPSRQAQSMLVSAIAQSANELQPKLQEFLLENLANLDRNTLLANATKIGSATWSRSPRRFCMFFDGSEDEALMAARAIETMHADELLRGISREPSVVPCVLTHRPEISSSTDFWLNEDAYAGAFEYLRNKPSLATDAVGAMIRSDASETLAWRAFSELDSRDIWSALAPAMDSLSGSGMHLVAAWVRHSAKDSGAIAETLASGRICTRRSLILLAKSFDPDFVPNDFGDDPWVLAARKAKGKVSEADLIFISAYLMSRALGRVSRNCGDLAVLAFERLHAATMRGDVADDTWRMLNGRLPRPSFWESWDRCEQLRVGVVDIFIRRELSPVLFLQLARDDELFALLVERTKNAVWSGRVYLRQVRQALLRERSSEGRDRRIRIVEEQLGDYGD